MTFLSRFMVFLAVFGALFGWAGRSLAAPLGNVVFRAKPSALTVPQIFLRNDPRIAATHVIQVAASDKRRITLEVSPPELGMDSGRTAMVLVTMTDSFGNSVKAERLKVTVNGRPVAMTSTDAGPHRGWVYAPSVRQPGDRLLIEASAPGAKPVSASIALLGTLATTLEAQVQPKALQADGKRSVLLEVTATDRHGMPAGDQTIRIRSEDGKLLFLHRVRPGFFRGRFQPKARSQGGQAVIVADTPRATRAEVSLDLKPIPHRLLITPLLGAFGDFLRTAGLGLSLRVEYGVHRGHPSVFVGGSLLLLPAFSIADGDGSLVDHRGVAAGGLVHSRLRMIASRRFGLDAVLDLGVLGLYSSFQQRYQNLVERHGRGRAVFTAAVGVEAALFTLGKQEIFLTIGARYLTGRFEDAQGRNRVLLHGGLGYRLPL